MSNAITARVPADTTMMGVVHDALRRDLRRLDRTLAAAGIDLEPQRRDALGAHVEWMLQLLHRHHHGEDAGLWPMVRERAVDPGAGELLDRMEADHAQIEPAMTRVTAVAARFRTATTEAARTDLLAALQNLSDVLLPHLRREEDEAMPLVSATISDVEWKTWDQTHNVKDKSLTQLASEGHWLLDNLDHPRAQVLLHLVPAPARLVIVKGFARRYRNACALRWGPELTVTPLPRNAA